jgi:CheY-like chemotaxis protein
MGRGMRCPRGFSDCSASSRGLEVVRCIRAREAATGRTRTPVVALSASALIGDRERFLAAGMDAFLAKPFSPPELYAVLRQVAPPPPILPEQPV